MRITSFIPVVLFVSALTAQAQVPSPTFDPAQDTLVAAPAQGDSAPAAARVMPRFIGLKKAAVQDTLALYQLTAKATYRYRYDAVAGALVYQRPAAREPLPDNGVVTLSYNDRERATFVRVPRFTGMTLADATKRAADVRLVVTDSFLPPDSAVKDTAVRKQSLAAGKWVRAGTSIRLTYVRPLVPSRPIPWMLILGVLGVAAFFGAVVHKARKDAAIRPDPVITTALQTPMPKYHGGHATHPSRSIRYTLVSTAGSAGVHSDNPLIIQEERTNV